MQKFFRTTTGHDGYGWPVLLLFFTVMVPSVGIVWMMRAAMVNERLAVRQRLTSAYQVQLETTKRQLVDRWHDQIRALESIVRDNSPEQAFARAVRSGSADAIVVLDESGRLAYPESGLAVSSPDSEMDDNWQRAQQLEFVDQQLESASEIYRTIADENHDVQRAARAEQALARCRLKLGDRDEAIAILNRLAEREAGTDLSGRSLAVDAQLRLLELLDSDSPEWANLVTRLHRRLNSYTGPPRSANQRRFAMRQLAAFAPQIAPFESLAAEDLAAQFLAQTKVEQRNLRSQDVTTSAAEPLRPTTIDGVWQILLPRHRAIALFRSATLQQQLQRLLEEQLLPPGVNVQVRPSVASSDIQPELLTASLAPQFSGWTLGLALSDGQLLDDRVNDRMAFYAWIATLLVGVTLALATWIATLLRRQIRVARLKNDLVATVSHELKTPLASIRLLVDTLLEEDQDSDDLTTQQVGRETNGRTREYLEMIANENARLSRLIDNFLTFSRMDRGKHRFQFQPTDANEIVQQAAAAVKDRFNDRQALLTVRTNGPLPVCADADALVTAVVNLLDNAWKYSGDDKQICLSASRQDQRAIIAVQDNGVGLTARAARRVFDRFYQVDQRLARSRGGCGLGLSIVQFVVEAHSGQATVESQLGKGSRFAISLPLDTNTTSTENAQRDEEGQRP